VNIRKIKSSLDNLYLEKQKLEKGDKPKKKPAAGKIKAKLRVEDDVSAFFLLHFH
jgi:translation initiation factor 3 subunit J